VDRVYLAVNGRSEPINFYSVDIHPYDVILGEGWLHRNRDILDYDSCQLLTRDVHDGVTPLCLNEFPPGTENGIKLESGMPHTKRVGGFLIGGSVETLGTVLDRRVRAAQGAEREQDLHRKSSGVRSRRMELWSSVRHALGTITGYTDKSLPEDEELVLEDIPGLTLPSPSTSQQGSATSAFSFIELEVHNNLAHMSVAVHEGVIQRLRTYEPTVFETRKLPRLATHRGLDMSWIYYWRRALFVKATDRMIVRAFSYQRRMDLSGFVSIIVN
jgi:hypothetical protein